MAATLEERYTREHGEVLLTGVQALVRLLLDQRRADRRAGLDTAALVSGYQGSPLAALDGELARRRHLLEQHQIVHRPALNEELAATALFGSQLVAGTEHARHDGVLGLWYGKAPGLDRAADAIRHANLMGVGARGGVLVAVGDDAQSKSSTLPSGSEANLFDLQLPTLAPGDAQEVLDLGLHGYALGRASGLWVGFKLATNVADGLFTATVGPDRVVPVAAEGPPLHHEPHGRMIAPAVLALERSLHEERLGRAAAYATANGLNRVVVAGPRDRVGIVAVGKAYLDLREALRALGLGDEALSLLGVRVLKVAMPYPLDAAAMRQFATGLREVIVVEEKRAFVELLLRDALYGMPEQPRISGKQDAGGVPLLPAHGELDADAIARALGPLLARTADAPSTIAVHLERLERAGPAPLPLGRLPHFCSGCPHNSSTKTPDGALVGGGIGCHGMVLLMDREQVGDVLGLTQMGGEGAQWTGMAPFTDREHFIQNVGDGTFAHSGSLSVRAAVAVGDRITFKILQNSAVAMTGGQTAVGGLSTPALTRLLAAEGVTRTIVTTDEPERLAGVALAPNTDVWPRTRVVEAQEELARTPGVTALVHDQECAAELRRKRKRGRAPKPAARAFVNERVCEGCGDCGRVSNCLSVHPVETEFGRKTRIDQGSCNQDLTCLEGDCPSFLRVIPGKGRRLRGRAPFLAAETLPDPPALARDEVAVRIAGVGGTGVVTVSQVLATAALDEGFAVRGLDQTGLAQKGGPVISDLRIARRPFEGANKLADGGCDLYIGCDLLVAADARALHVADAGRTRAVLAARPAPTAAQVRAPELRPLSDDALRARVDERLAAPAELIDAGALTRELLGSEQAANTLLVGVACQLGLLPLRPESIESALRLNGAAVDDNVQAFRRGRQLVADPDGFERTRVELVPGAPDGSHAGQDVPSSLSVRDAAVAALVAAPPQSRLRALVDRRVGELSAYQSPAYARRYAEEVERVRRAEEACTPGAEGLAEAVAFHLHQLMAYKDEYEVARLHLDPALRAAVEHEFGPGAQMSWMLHPPLLRALGMRRKLELGPWFTPALRVLRRARRLRGTRLDPFGFAHVRRVERELVDEYVAVARRLADMLTPAGHALAVEIAALPDLVRGYEEIKLRNVERYRARLAQLLDALGESARR